jgi:flagellar hook protein FlgE
MPFRIALSGLDAASSDLKVTGNNIANANTSGFKLSRSEFADIFASSSGSVDQTAIGGGVRLAAVAQDFAQGNIESTGNNLDMAINGEGFFLLDNQGIQLVSRAGAFRVNKDGFIENAQGYRLQAYPALDDTGESFSTGSPQDLQLSSSENPPQATSSIELNMNLLADAEDLGTIGTIDPTDATSYSYSNSTNIYDSLGISHTASLYFRKTAPNTWGVAQYIDDNPVQVQTGGSVADVSTITFNADGSLSSGGTITYDPYNLGNGSNPLELTLNLEDSTQFGSDFSVNNLSQDGFTTGRLNNFSVDEKGIISARYTNGQSQALGKVVIANVNNPNGLAQKGDSTWSETTQSGSLQLGEAGTGKMGSIQTSSLESSNVDIAKQLVNLITAQRSFQANAQVISTADTISQTMINLR